MNERFLIRCDVAPSVGTGHLYRCLTLARALKNRNAYVAFLCRAKNVDLRNELENVADEWEQIGWKTSPIKDSQVLVKHANQWNIDVAIVDHYRVRQSYQSVLRENGVQWMQFDWSANFPLWADWILNANPAAKESDYQRIVQQNGTSFLLGPQYALLRDEFKNLPKRSAYRDEVESILLSFGGGDDRGATVKCLNALKGVASGATRLVCTTSENENLKQIRTWIERHPEDNVELVVNTRRMAQHLYSSGLAIIAGGTTTFEAAATGLPFLIVQIASNQAPNAKAWQDRGAAVNLGGVSELRSEYLKRKVAELLDDPLGRREMGEAGREQVDGKGADRVARKLFNE